MIRSSRLFLSVLLLLILAGYGEVSASGSIGSTLTSTIGGDSLFNEDQLSNGGDTSGALVGDETVDMLKEAEDEANLMNGFIIGQVNNLMTIPGINSLQNLVFGNPYETWGFGNDPSDKLVDGIFFQSELENVIHPLIATFSGVYATVLMLAIMMSSMKLGMKAHSPQSKEDFWKDVHMYVASAFFMGLFWMLFHILMATNWGIVQGVASTLQSLNKPLDGISIIATATNDDSYSFKMGDLFVFLAEWGLAAYLNFIYIARKIIIILLCVMSPFAAYSLLFAKTRSFFGTYMKELLGNIFLPSIHAIILFIFVQMAGNLGQGMGPMIFKLGMIIMFVPVTGMVSKWLNLGDASTSMGRTATALGLGSIGGAMMLSRNVMSMTGKGKAGFGNSSSSGSGGAGAETPGGTDVPMGNDAGRSAITRAAEGGSTWNKIKKVGSVGGAVAGGTFGLPFGAGGVAAGAAIGSKAVAGVLQTTRNATTGARDLGRTALNSFRGTDANGNPSGKISLGNFKEKWSDLAERRQMVGNLGEAAGKMTGAAGATIGGVVAGPVGAAIGGAFGNKIGTAGRAMGQMLSGVSRQRAFEHGAGIRMDGSLSPRGMTMDQIASDPRFSGSEARWNQTNDRSWYEAKDAVTGNWERVGGYGAGDSSLKTGQLRMIDYDIRKGSGPNGGETWTRGENGSYTRTINQPLQSDDKGNILQKPRTERELVGMSGSSASFGRKSEAYIADTSRKKLYSDNSFDHRRLNTEDYFNHTNNGRKSDVNGKVVSDMRSGSDKVADFVGLTAPKMTRSATKNFMEGAKRVGWAQAGAYNNTDRKRDII
ncbi:MULTISPECIES: hypothetical protein [unclassified Paenibacillus]|uniref:TrbL/VirB6 plasmid conjugal transfer protein n=1 Tax=Paenibacillus provencensis TaxID=441151 RepID=A0ABW3Q299_9BACL|nr:MULTISPECIES: hypothetical protein [unclassified Paenibacillus]MCM3130197.1 hypothetical protein [Paenibacillus sp. MER 78]SDX71509.1 hypothetical protein SAMN05518848_11289 [Paenibacillus sp. PDC88]SFS88763.1 hypothetical protein SAMN04488601_10685 [Paenibacillus sp. 453mf]